MIKSLDCLKLFCVTLVPFKNMMGPTNIIVDGGEHKCQWIQVYCMKREYGTMKVVEMFACYTLLAPYTVSFEVN